MKRLSKKPKVTEQGGGRAGIKPGTPGSKPEPPSDPTRLSAGHPQVSTPRPPPPRTPAPLLSTGQAQVKLILKKAPGGDFPGGAVVENPPANAGDTGSSPGLGRSHMPRSN